MFTLEKLLHTHTHTNTKKKPHLNKQNVGYLNQIYDNVDINRDLKNTNQKINKNENTLLLVKKMKKSPIIAIYRNYSLFSDDLQRIQK